MLLLCLELSDILWPSRCLALAPHTCTSCFSMAGEVIPPPYVITADNKGGLIVVTGAAVLAFVWSCFLIRVWLRMQSGEWRSDGECLFYPTACETCTKFVHLDWWLAAATLLDTVQSGIIFHLANLGLGASQDGVPLSQLERLGRVRTFMLNPVPRSFEMPRQGVGSLPLCSHYSCNARANFHAK
jgi:hypothetical protein